jgi:hypothetical protein
MSNPHGAVRTTAAAHPPSTRKPPQDGSFDGLVAGTLRPVQQVRAALPAETTGWDPEYLACVSVDPRGMPLGVRIVDDWHRRVAPAALGEAVTAAAGAAARALDERARVAFEQATGADAATPWERTGDPRTTPAAGASRPLDQVAEDSIASLAAMNHSLFPTSAGAAPVGVGSALDGGIEVQVGAGGLLACTLRGQRVAAASAAILSTALTAAARAARADLDRQLDEFAPPHSEELLAEVFTYLTSADFQDDRTGRGGRA